MKKYIENRVSLDDLEEIRNSSTKVEKRQRFQYFMMGNHYGRLFRNQQLGYHWFYTSGPEEKHCTCGLTISIECLEENASGHRNLPSQTGETSIFINRCEFDSVRQKYLFGAICQICSESSEDGLCEEKVSEWISSHGEKHDVA